MYCGFSQYSLLLTYPAPRELILCAFNTIELMLMGKIKTLSVLSIFLLVLTGCARLGSITYTPEQTPESWLEMQPYLNLKLWGVEFILAQPSSTVFVYLLGLLTIAVGLYFFKIQDHHQSRKWWGIALLLWGLGALFAGTSYQAFSYEIKCAGKAICSWTSWWEIVYLVLSVASIDAILISGAYSSCQGKFRTPLLLYAILNFFSYCVLVTIGVITLTKFLISFELLLIVTAPSILLLFVINGWRYFNNKNGRDLALLVTWIWLGAVIALYFIYLVLGLTEYLWERGIWFSENDLLHIGLISWMSYIGFRVAKLIKDAPTLEFNGTADRA